MIESQTAYNRGRQFLEAHTTDGAYQCYVHPEQSRDVEANDQLTPPEAFSSAVVAGLLASDEQCQPIVSAAADYLATQVKDGQFTFFEDATLCPPDTDTTSLGHTVLYQADKIDQAALNKAVDTILSLADDDGLLQVWLDPQASRPNYKDPVVTANALHLFHTAQRGGNTTLINEEWLGNVLRSQEYFEGTRYYYSPDAFLYFFGRLILDFPEVGDRHEGPLRQALTQRIGTTDHAIETAMRAILAERLNMPAAVEAETATLLSLQAPGGWWPADALYRGNELYWGSRVLSTAFAVGALSRQIA